MSQNLIDYSNFQHDWWDAVDVSAESTTHAEQRGMLDDLVKKCKTKYDCLRQTKTKCHPKHGGSAYQRVVYAGLLEQRREGGLNV